jgi:hypothetical protein
MRNEVAFSVCDSRRVGYRPSEGRKGRSTLASKPAAARPRESRWAILVGIALSYAIFGLLVFALYQGFHWLIF